MATLAKNPAAAGDDAWLDRERDRQWWLGVTDAGRHSLTIAAVAIPMLRGQWRDAAAAGGALLVTHRLCGVMKHLTTEVRPDGSDDKSFPSSHSLEAFSAATSLMGSAGASLGVPAFAAAGLIAHGRLRAQRHHLRDVLAGGAAGAASALAAGWAARAASRAWSRRMG